MFYDPVAEAVLCVSCCCVLSTQKLEQGSQAVVGAVQAALPLAQQGGGNTNPGRLRRFQDMLRTVHW